VTLIKPASMWMHPAIFRHHSYLSRATVSCSFQVIPNLCRSLTVPYQLSLANLVLSGIPESPSKVLNVLWACGSSVSHNQASTVFTITDPKYISGIKKTTNAVQLRAEVAVVDPLMCKTVLLLTTKHVHRTALHAADHLISTNLPHTQRRHFRHKRLSKQLLYLSVGRTGWKLSCAICKFSVICVKKVSKKIYVRYLKTPVSTSTVKRMCFYRCLKQVQGA